MTELRNGNMGIPQWTLGDRLRKAREQRGLGVQDLANELGISRNSVGNYESGRTRPPRPTLIVWSMRCGVPIEWLQTGIAAGPETDGDGSAERARRDSNPQPSDPKSDGRLITFPMQRLELRQPQPMRIPA